MQSLAFAVYVFVSIGLLLTLLKPWLTSVASTLINGLLNESSPTDIS